MTCEQCQDSLGDAVDGALDPVQRAQVDGHIRECSACRDLLDDLKEIRAAAATLDRQAPSPDLWRAIAAKVETADVDALATTRVRQAAVWLQPRALAAAAAVLAMLGTAAWLALGTEWRGGSDSTPPDLARNAAFELQLAEQHYQNAISALEQLTVAKDTALDPVVSGEIAQSLTSIDRAIADSRAALTSNPDSFVARTSLLEALRMKVAVLQETVSLMNATS